MHHSNELGASSGSRMCDIVTRTRRRKRPSPLAAVCGPVGWALATAAVTCLSFTLATLPTMMRALLGVPILCLQLLCVVVGWVFCGNGRGLDREDRWRLLAPGLLGSFAAFASIVASASALGGG